MTKSSPSGSSFLIAFKLNGTPMIQRKRSIAGWERDSVTVPMTSTMRMAIQLLERFGDVVRAYHGASDDDLYHLAQFEKRWPRYLDGEQIRAEVFLCPRCLSNTRDGCRANAADLVRNANNRGRAAREGDAAGKFRRQSFRQ